MLDILLVTGSYVLVILIGSICAQSGFIASETKNVVSKMLFYITLPATVIYSFVGFEFDATLLIASAMGLASTLLGFFGTVLYTMKKSPEKRAFHTLLGYGYNVGCFALPFVSAQFGPAGVVAACMFDLGNCIMVSGGGYALTRAFILKKRTEGVLLSILRTLLKSPALDCYVVLILLSLAGLSVPASIGVLLEPLMHANSFLAMFMIGLAMEWKIDKGRLKEVLQCLCWRVFVAVVFCAIVYFFIPMAESVKVVTIVCMLAPIMSVGLVYVMWIDGDTKMAGFAISLSVAVSLVLMTTATMLLS